MIWRVIISVLVFVAGLTVMTPEKPAVAQGLFDRLFGRQPAQPPPAIRQAPPPGRGVQPAPPRQARPAQPRRPAPDPQPALVEVQPKEPGALKVLVVGDFLAKSLAAGLDQAFAEEPGIAVIDRAVGDSGLVRIDAYDWSARLPEILNEVQPDFVALMVGTNDRQDINLTGGRLDQDTPEWERVYQTRVAGIAETLRVYGRPAFWVGLPPLSSREAAADMARFNAIYRTGMEAAGGKFIDIWSGFADETGRFVTRGPDIEGQVRTLRAGDGINFTRSGARKLAFYLDREIRRPDRDAGRPGSFIASTAPGNRIEVLPDGTKLMVGPVISLGDPPPGAARELAGAIAPPPPDPASVQHRLVLLGEALPAVAGRADDFTWPPDRRPTAMLLRPPPQPGSPAWTTRPDELAAARLPAGAAATTTAAAAAP